MLSKQFTTTLGDVTTTLEVLNWNNLSIKQTDQCPHFFLLFLIILTNTIENLSLIIASTKALNELI